MSERLWNRADAPKKEWAHEGVEDYGDATETCEMCCNIGVRYVHTVSHARHGRLRVGGDCAEKMTKSEYSPRRREAELQSRANRRRRFLNRRWRRSTKGNPYLNIEGRNVVIFRDGGRHKFCVDGVFSSNWYVTEDEAKLGAFDYLFPTIA